MKMYGLTTQCIGKIYYQMFQLSATVPNLCPQRKSSLINHLIDDRHQHLAQNFNRPASIALPRFYYLCTKIRNVRKSQV